MHRSRRDVLRLGAGASVAALAGCTGLPFVDNPVNMSIHNRSAEGHHVRVELLRADTDEYSEALAYRESFDLPGRPESEGGEFVERDDVAPSGRYRVRVTVDHEYSQEFTFHPDCTGGDPPDDEFYLELASDGRGVQYQQNTCSTDDWVL